MATAVSSLCKPLKMEVVTQNGDTTDFFPTEASPTSDYLTAKGISFQNSLTTYIDSTTAGNMQFQDATVTDLISLNQLRTASSNIFDNATNSFASTTVQTAIEEAKGTNPATKSLLFDDFFNSTLAGQLGWTVVTNGAGSQFGYKAVSTGTEAGIIAISAAGGGAGRTTMHLGLDSLLPASGLTIETRLLIPILATTAQDFVVHAGLHNTTAATADAINGLYFKYDRSVSTNWLITTANNNTIVNTAITAVPVSANTWYKVKFQLTSSTSLNYYINDTLYGSLTSNFPSSTTGNFGPGIKIYSKVGGNTKTASIDYYYLEKPFGTAR